MVWPGGSVGIADSAADSHAERAAYNTVRIELANPRSAMDVVAITTSRP